MKTSDKGIAEIAEHEGVVLGPYRDSQGIWTYGVGHTAAAGGLNPEKMPKVDTRNYSSSQVQEELLRAVRVFALDLKSYENRVNRAITRPLKQHQFDALVSFDFNTGGIFRANLTRDINAGVFDGRGFMGWLKPKEIIKRRKAEQHLFLTGDYDGNGSRIPVYDALPDGRTRFRMTVDSRQLLSMMTVKPTLIPPTSSTNRSIVSVILGWVKSFLNP